MPQKTNLGLLERRFRLQWLHDLTTPMFLLDKQGKMTFCNTAFQELTGSMRRRMCGKGLDVFIVPTDAPRFIRDELQLFRGTPLGRVSYELLRADNGKRLQAEMNLNPIFDTKHKKVEFIIGLILSSEEIA